MNHSSLITHNSQLAKPDLRHVPVRDEIVRVYQEENDGLTCPWSAKHAKILQRTLATAVNWTAGKWIDCVLYRFASEGVPASEDPQFWIAQLAKYANGPLNRFNKSDRVPPECWAKFRALCARYQEVRSRESGDGSQKPETFNS